MRVLVTRAEPAASETADVLRVAGESPLVFPLLSVDDVGTRIPVETYDAYVFTSRSSVQVLSARNWRCPDPQSIAYCVGDKTAKDVVTLGFSDVRSASGNARDLANLIFTEHSGRPLRLLYLAGRQRSFDMEQALSNDGFDVDLLEIYEIGQVFPSSQEVQKMLNELGPGCVFLYSHNTAKHVCNMLFSEQGDVVADRLIAIANSAKTAEAVLKYPWQGVYVAEEATEQSMISKLKQVSLV